MIFSRKLKELENHRSLYCSPDYSHTFCVQSNLDFEKKKLLYSFLYRGGPDQVERTDI